MFRAASVMFVLMVAASLVGAKLPSASTAQALGAPSIIAIDRPGLFSDAVELRDWTPNVVVTVEVLGSAMPSISVPVDGAGFALVPLPSLMSGQTVRASLALVVKEVAIVPLSVQADATADVVTGAGPAGVSVTVQTLNGVGLATAVTQIDVAGRFVVSFGNLAPNTAADIRLGSTFNATILDGDGDGQRVEGYVSPTVSAVVGASSTIVLNGWRGFPATMVIVQVFANPGGIVLFTSSVPPDANGFVLAPSPALLPGQMVRGSDGVTTKDLVIVPLTVQGNTATDVVSGNAPSNALVTVQAHCTPPSSTACVSTRLLQANGAGSYSVALGPLIDIRGGSDFSASVGDAEGDRQYAKVAPIFGDGDRDGIEDLIDTDGVNPSALFTVTTTAGTTMGRILSDGGLMVTVAHALPPDGVIAQAVGGPPAAIAEVEVCAPPFVVQLTAGDQVVLTCGSLTARVLSGPVEIRVPGFSAVVSVPTGSTVKLTVLPTGELQVQNIAGTTSISITASGVTTLVPAGGSRLIPLTPVLPTNANQCKDGGWKTFGVFKNQGDCVSFVATKGKNGPAW